MLNELLASAETPDDLQAVADLVSEQERGQADRSRWEVVTLGDVAEFFGLNTQTVKQWRTESPPMPGREGAWPLPAIVKWRHQKLTQSDIRTARQQADLELQQVAVEQKRLELARQKGELVPLADVELWASEFIVMTREMLLKLPEDIATSADPSLREDARKEADECVRNVLKMLLQKVDPGAIDVESDPPA